MYFIGCFLGRTLQNDMIHNLLFCTTLLQLLYLFGKMGRHGSSKLQISYFANQINISRQLTIKSTSRTYNTQNVKNNVRRGIQTQSYTNRQIIIMAYGYRIQLSDQIAMTAQHLQVMTIVRREV